jgi:5-methylcytosine-specific restriction endonuclease McrA
MPNDPRLKTRAYKHLRLEVLARDRYLCQIRGPRCTLFASEVDHIVARADGGSVMDPANMQASCSNCNGRRNALRTNAKYEVPRNRPWYLTSIADRQTRL